MIYQHIKELEAFVAEGLCSKRKHGQFPIWIYNYTSRTQYKFGAATWPESLLDARGLVLDGDGNIVARGFRKFFNLDQLQQVPEGVPEVWEKLDGSMILAFQYDGWVVCSTRGSFESDQAAFAAEYLASTVPRWVPSPGQTYLFEAIYPANRIVVDYGQRSELVFLSAVNLDGVDVSCPAPPPVPCAKYYGMMPPSKLPFSTEEGFVLRWPCSTRAKVKMPEYNALHRVIFGVSSRAIWETLRVGGDPLAELHRMTPPLAEWTKSYAERLVMKYAEEEADAYTTFNASPAGVTRAEFAAFAKNTPRPNLQFALLDGKPISDMIWKAIEPPFERPSCIVEES